MTVAIASYNAATFIEATLASVLAQTLSAIEVIVVDDGSVDDTVAIARRVATRDHRVQVMATPRNLGPGGARNVALSTARGHWFAVLDADDLMTPDRLSRLVAAGEETGADIVADDLIVFDHNGRTAPVTFLGAADPADGTGWIDLAGYLERTVMYGNTPDLGFLKPMIRTGRLRATGIRYDEGLRIAEDDDLIVRMLVAGLSYRLVGSAGYLYRRHDSSISHRLSAADAGAMRRASATRLAAADAHDARVRRAFAARHRAMQKAEAFARWVEAVKARRLTTAFAVALAQPRMLPLLHLPIGAALGRIRRSVMHRRGAPQQKPETPEVAVAAALALAAHRSDRETR